MSSDWLCLHSIRCSVLAMWVEVECVEDLFFLCDDVSCLFRPTSYAYAFLLVHHSIVVGESLKILNLGE